MRLRHPCCLIQKARVVVSSAWRTMEAINLDNDDDDNYDDDQPWEEMMLIPMMMINIGMMKNAWEQSK